MIDSWQKTRFRPKREQDLGLYSGTSRKGEFTLGERVCVRRPLRNDGTYPHRDLGEVLVLEGDFGFVVEINRFRSEIYYTIEFAERDVVMAVRARDLVSLRNTAPSPRLNA